MIRVNDREKNLNNLYYITYFANYLNYFYDFQLY